MTFTFRCTGCLRTWWPYQALNGCPTCGSGTRRSHEPVDEDCVEAHQAALSERSECDRRARLQHEFDLFYARREAARLDAESEAA